MAIKLIANYSKRLGLPGYSSHQFEVSIETEISNPAEVQAVSANIYNPLQSAVDEQIQQVGFVPDEQYGKQGQAPAASAPAGYNQTKSYGHYSAQPDTPAQQEDRWQCTEKQQSMNTATASPIGLPTFQSYKADPAETIWQAKPLPEVEPLRPLYLSPSSVKSYLACPLNYYYDRVVGLRERTSVALHIGKAIHATLQAFKNVGAYKASWSIVV